eukprot:CAMPEP_0173105694 /NCGR_PEP_ID=MMETSP1102-20130122/40338_1 /TAXON_ID=49646 /ORGANISM="Geminigera sp., Strain Caron Lab Isolate" /LENGTH=60 /DNA_ID=CAMNT_0014002149 /DNA_START=56 /DNA_END=238 /DNA_ORIENTATION=-
MGMPSFHLPTPEEVENEGGHVTGSYTSTDFHCENGVCNGKTLTSDYHTPSAADGRSYRKV